MKPRHFDRKPSRTAAEFKCWLTYAPHTSQFAPGLIRTARHQAGSALCLRPVLPMRPPRSRVPSLAGHYSRFIATTNSCANPASSCRLRPLASHGRSLQVAASSLLPAGSSRCYLCESFPRCLVPCSGGPTECTCLFLPLCHRPSSRVEKTSRLPASSAERLLSGGCFVAADIH